MKSQEFIKKHLITLISLVAMLIISLILIFVLHKTRTKDSLEEVYGINYKLTINKDFTKTDYILSEKTVNGKKNKGYIYRITKSTDVIGPVKGSITLDLALSLDYEIIAYKIIKYDHTKDLSKDKESGYFQTVKGYLDSLVANKVKLNEIKKYNKDNKKLYAGTTKSSIETIYFSINELTKYLVSKGKFKEEILEVILPYQIIYGKDAKKEEDQSFSKTTLVSKKEKVTGSKNKGYIYTAKKEIEVDMGYYGIVKGLVTLELYLDENNIIIGYNLPEYPHTRGYPEPYLDKLIEDKVDVTKYDNTKYKDLVAGSTESINKAFKPLLDAIKEVVK